MEFLRVCYSGIFKGKIARNIFNSTENMKTLAGILYLIRIKRE